MGQILVSKVPPSKEPGVSRALTVPRQDEESALNRFLILAIYLLTYLLEGPFSLPFLNGGNHTMSACGKADELFWSTMDFTCRRTPEAKPLWLSHTATYKGRTQSF